MEAKEIERCIDEFGTDIYRFCLKLCMNREDAEDLYQQTFLKALESSYILDWEENPRAFFFSAAHNLWKSDRRKAARRSAIASCTSIDEGQEHDQKEIGGSRVGGRKILIQNLISCSGLRFRQKMSLRYSLTTQ